MKRWIPLVVVFVTVAGLAVWMLTRGSDDRVREKRSAIVETANGRSSSIDASDAAASGADPADARMEDEVDVEATDFTTAPETGEKEAGPEFAHPTEDLRGRLVVVDEEGVESRSESGTMKVTLRSADSGGFSLMRTVAVVNGGWSVAVRATHIDSVREVTIREIDLGGRLAVREGDPRDPVEVVPGEPVVVRARWCLPTLLHVLDATTKAALDDVEIRERNDRKFAGHEHPGVLHDLVIAAAAASPIEVGAGEHRLGRTVLVGCPGYAWRPIKLTQAGGERIVELDPGGTLRIRLNSEGETPRAVVRLYAKRDTSNDLDVEDVRSALQAASPDEISDLLAQIEMARESVPPEQAIILDGFESVLRGDDSTAAIVGLFDKVQGADFVGSPMLEVPVGSRDVIDLDGLTPRTYRVRVELGEWFREPKVFAEKTVRVEAGERREILLAWHAPEVPALTKLALTVRCPVAWQHCHETSIEQSMQSVALELEGPTATGGRGRYWVRADDVRREGDDFVFEYEPVELEPGRYKADIGLHEFPARIEVAEGEPIDHLVRLPEPVYVVLSVVEKGTGAPVMEGELSWVPKQIFGSGGVVSKRVARVAGRNRFEFCASQRLIEVDYDGRYRASRSFALSEGSNDLTLEVQAISKISFVLKHEETRIPIDSGTMYDVEVLEPGGRVVSWSSSSVRVPSPGLYRITIPRVSGYELVPPFEVRVAKGEDVEREIELVPVR